MKAKRKKTKRAQSVVLKTSTTVQSSGESRGRTHSRIIIDCPKCGQPNPYNKGEECIKCKSSLWGITSTIASVDQELTDNFLASMNTIGVLSMKEMQISGLVVRCCKNEEIGGIFGNSEQVIKNSLRKIYDKVGVSDRLSLGIFVINHPELADAVAATLQISRSQLLSWNPVDLPPIRKPSRQVYRFGRIRSKGNPLGVLASVSRFTGVSVTEMQNGSSRPKAVEARDKAVYALMRHAKLSISQTATVLHQPIKVVVAAWQKLAPDYAF